VEKKSKNYYQFTMFYNHTCKACFCNCICQNS